MEPSHLNMGHRPSGVLTTRPNTLPCLNILQAATPATPQNINNPQKKEYRHLQKSGPEHCGSNTS